MKQAVAPRNSEYSDLLILRQTLYRGPATLSDPIDFTTTPAFSF
jgi:hypothetical protein